MAVGSRRSGFITLSNSSVNVPVLISRSNINSIGIVLSGINCCTTLPSLGGMFTRGLPAKSKTAPTGRDMWVVSMEVPILLLRTISL